MSKFLDTSTTEAEVREILAPNEPIRAAVAYWGDGAVKKLGIKKGQNLTVICDLLSGCCNPAEIERLRKAIGRRRVLTRDRLHAKVWLGKTAAILGSSNASASGLCFEGDEATSLVEANTLIQEPGIIAALGLWWDQKVLPGARQITDDDLRRAAELFRRRRQVRPVPLQYSDLLTALRAEPNAFSDRDLYVWVYPHGNFDAWVEAAGKAAKNLHNNSRIEYWQDVENPPPPASYIIDFNSEGSRPSWSGIYRILADQPVYVPVGNEGTLLLATRVNSFAGLKRGDLKPWIAAAAKAAKVDEDGQWSADEFAKRFL
jgi:hypothetical protein